MSRTFSICLLGVLFTLMLQPAAASLTGEYWAVDEGEHVVLRLEEEAGDKLSGVLLGEGLSYRLKGGRHDNDFTGVLEVEGEQISVSGHLNGEKLYFTLVESGYNEEETLLFHRGRDDARAAPAPRQDEAAQSQVIVNGRALDRQQLALLEQIYNVIPRPGNYWYDARSGLYGVVGYPAWGFMLPGHDLGRLQSDASNGATGVFINGRQLPQSEWVVWSQMLGYLIQPGRYWLDSNGNAGYEGNPAPAVNLYQAARQNAYSGGVGAGGSSGTGGDNFWSSRFSAGNYDQGNSRGYVSVPGYGPVGYGF